MGIKSSKTKTDESAAKIKNIADQFDLTLSNEDGVTTIPANENSKKAFEDSAKTMRAFGEQLAIEAQNIETIGVTFDELDKVYADLNENLGK